MPIVTVFGSGKCLPDSLEYESAEKIGSLLAEAGFDIATGGYKGVMEAVCKGAKDKVRRIAVTTSVYPNKKPNDFISEHIIKDTYLERLAELVNMADAFIVLGGGTGTLLELSTVWALKERNLLGNKPLVCVGDQWNEVIQTMSFYSETVQDHTQYVFHVDDEKDAINHIINELTLMGNGAAV